MPIVWEQDCKALSAQSVRQIAFLIPPCPSLQMPPVLAPLLRQTTRPVLIVESQIPQLLTYSQGSNRLLLGCDLSTDPRGSSAAFLLRA